MSGKALAAGIAANPDEQEPVANTIPLTYFPNNARSVSQTGTGTLRSSQQAFEVVFAEDRHAQLLGLGQLAAGVFAGHDVVGLLRDAGRGPAAVPGDQVLDLVARCTCSACR